MCTKPDAVQTQALLASGVKPSSPKQLLGHFLTFITSHAMVTTAQKARVWLSVILMTFSKSQLLS
jgi:hypothetical protein